MLQSQELTKKFGEAVLAVDKLSFEVYQQDIFALLGPNGAGKSTTMKMLATILPPTSGDALVSNVSITKQPAKVREIIGYVPQLISADGSLTGYENLLLFAKLYRIPHQEREARIQESLETMGLAHVADRYVHDYSGGMVRRLEIILAMLHKPQILFLDEPTSGLDPVAKKAVWDHLLLMHKREGITIIITTHDMQEAEYLCNRVAIMLHGKIAAIGATAELKATVGPNASLNDVFISYAGNSMETEHAFKAMVTQRKTEERRG